MSNYDLVVLKVQLYKETERAIYVGKAGLNKVVSSSKVWLPLSLITYSSLEDIGSVGEIEIPDWLYGKNEDALIDCLVDR